MTSSVQYGASPTQKKLEAQIRATFNEALAQHQRGQFKQAQALYEAILRAQPRHYQSLYYFGLLHAQSGSFQSAADLIGRAIEIHPVNPEFHFYLGNCLQQLQRLEDAVEAYDKAIGLSPEFSPAHSNRGFALQALNRLDAAVASYRKALAITAADALVHCNLAAALLGLQQFDAALASCDKAIALKPDYAEAHTNRGAALYGRQRFEAAIASYDRAIAINPGYAKAHTNRGVAFQELGQLQVALASHDSAIAIDPNYADAYSNRGITLHALRRLEDAVASYDKAIALRPEFVAAYFNRGLAFHELRQPSAALASFDQATAIDPGSAQAHFNKSLTLLLEGNFQKGLPLYEWRWKTEKSKPRVRNFEQALWLGEEPLAGKTLLLHSEQGFGDTIQFCRYATRVAFLGARVILEVPEPLLGVLGGLGANIELAVKGKPLPAFDYHCPLLSTPLAFKTDATSIPASQSYLRSDSAKLAEWEQRLEAKTKPRVGLVWSGNADHVNDHNRSIALSALLAALPDTLEYVSLQKEVRASDKQALKSNGHIRHFGDALKDFGDTAALCEWMDLVISVDTSAAHLSGALGRPTWVLLPYVPDWRWLLDREDSPWYPSVKLYRQNDDRDWANVLDAVKADLVNCYIKHSG
jgi:tetratricopeptide (TPR) repeat protein